MLTEHTIHLGVAALLCNLSEVVVLEDLDRLCAGLPTYAFDKDCANSGHRMLREDDPEGPAGCDARFACFSAALAFAHNVSEPQIRSENMLKRQQQEPRVDGGTSKLARGKTKGPTQALHVCFVVTVVKDLLARAHLPAYFENFDPSSS